MNQNLAELIAILVKRLDGETTLDLSELDSLADEGKSLKINHDWEQGTVHLSLIVREEEETGNELEVNDSQKEQPLH